MFYYEVATAGNTKGASSVFTYESTENLEIGRIVRAPLRGKSCLGFIVKKSSKPGFKTNTLSTYELDIVLPQAIISTFNDLCRLYPYAQSQLAGLFMPPIAPKRSIDEATDPNLDIKDIPALGIEQRKIVNNLESDKRNSILFGDTGTGKTRMYEHLIQAAVNNGKNVVVLAPEIGLSTYLYKELRTYFPDILLYHSNMTPKNRYQSWMRAAKSNGGTLIVGPRSALSLPLANIGLIVMDEAHDSSYRQEGSPYLHTKVLAAILAGHHGAQSIYGTATPAVVDYFKAIQLGNPIETISEQAVKSEKKSTVRILDYADESERNGGSILKSSMEAIRSAVMKGGQSLVLVNRRGTARYVACDGCGHEERCSRCDHLVVYHHDSYELRCHFCNTNYPVTNVCSECGSNEIKMRSYGTKAIVEELMRAFPDVTIKRFDTDTSKKDHLQEHTDSLKDGSVQIIVGTQMIAKGLDLPKLMTLVVLSGAAGSGFGGEERDFQLLYQVIGRAMRGHQDTEIMIQTSNPKSSMLDYAINRNYLGFYKSELLEREKFTYPPYCHLMVVHISRKTSKGASSASNSVRSKIQSLGQSVNVTAPMPNITERIGDNYHWHLLVRSADRSTLVNIAKDIGTGYVCELDPIDTP